MRKIGSIYKWFPLAAFISLAACKGEDEPDLSWLTNPETKMELTASADYIELDRDKPDDVALTFHWTPAREMPDDYVISYVTKMDVEGREFSTSLRTDEEYDVFSKSFTTDELQRLLLEKWGQSYSNTSPMQFRVIAKWNGGSRYAMPEVRTVTVNIRPYRPLVWEADHILLSGSSILGDPKEMSKTMENEFQYAFVDNLLQGEVEISLETTQGATYIKLAEGVEEWVDGEEVDVVLGDEPTKLNLPKDGEYRFILNTETRKLRIYSPDKKLEPYVAVFYDRLDGGPYSVTVTNLLGYGDITNWNNELKNGNFTPSLADPQLLVSKTAWVSYWGSGPTKLENAKFVLDIHNLVSTTFPGGPNYSWCVGPVVPEGQPYLKNVPLPMGVWTPIGMGSSVEQRESSFRWLMISMFTMIDLRNQRIYMQPL